MDSKLKKENGRVFKCIKFRPFTGMEHFEDHNREGDLLKECEDGWFINEKFGGRTDILNLKGWEEFFEEAIANIKAAFRREDVYHAIDSERDFQEAMKNVDSSHVVEDFPLAAGLEAIRYNLDKANKAWYTEQVPYPEAMESVRKIAAICVQMGEKYEMQLREPLSNEPT